MTSHPAGDERTGCDHREVPFSGVVEGSTGQGRADALAFERRLHLGMRVHHQVGGPYLPAEPGVLAADPCFEAAAVGGVRDGDESAHGRVLQLHGARHPVA